METTQLDTSTVEPGHTSRVRALAFRDGVERILTLRATHVRSCSECGKNVEIRTMLLHMRKHHGIYHA